MRADIENLVTSVEKSLELLRQRMDWDTVSHRLEEFDARVENPNLWDNPEEAQKLMRERQTLLDAMEGHNQIRDDLSYNIEIQTPEYTTKLSPTNIIFDDLNIGFRIFSKRLQYIVK